MFCNVLFVCSHRSLIGGESHCSVDSTWAVFGGSTQPATLAKHTLLARDTGLWPRFTHNLDKSQPYLRLERKMLVAKYGNIPANNDIAEVFKLIWADIAHWNLRQLRTLCHLDSEATQLFLCYSKSLSTYISANENVLDQACSFLHKCLYCFVFIYLFLVSCASCFLLNFCFVLHLFLVLFSWCVQAQVKH